MAVVVASANPPTSIEPAEFKVTTPPVNVESVKVHPPTLPPVNNTCEPVTSPPDFTLKTAEDVPAFKLAAPAKNLASPVDDIPVYVPPVNLFIVFGAIVQFAI